MCTNALSFQLLSAKQVEEKHFRNYGSTKLKTVYTH